MTIELWLKETSQPIVYNNADTSYSKGPFYVIKVGDVVYKYPLFNIWRVGESY